MSLDSRMTPARLLSRVAARAWAAPNTALGLTVGLMMLALGGRARLVDGVIEFHGGLLARAAGARSGRCDFGAMTLGHVILGASPSDLAALRRHEHVHVGQYERWGPLFLPAYAASSLWQLAHGRRAYRDNQFERQAYAVAERCEAGPPAAPTRAPQAAVILAAVARTPVPDRRSLRRGFAPHSHTREDS